MGRVAGTRHRRRRRAAEQPRRGRPLHRDRLGRRRGRAAVGGAGALIAKRIKQYTVLAYGELGPEAVASMTVEDFPAIVVMDSDGKDFYQVGQAPYIQE